MSQETFESVGRVVLSILGSGCAVAALLMLVFFFATLFEWSRK